jgi:phosphorylcholine metabolism protein LicD
MKQNYLNNRDILKEIHKSKTTYCSFLSPSDCDYDIILPGVDKINKKNIAEGKKLRVERLTRAAYDAAQTETTVKLKLDEFAVKPSKISVTDIVFRIMTWDHVPVDVAKTRKAAEKLAEEEAGPVVTEYDDFSEVTANTKYIKVNFPPFQHYKIDDQGTPYLVGKSHWQGDLDSGEFCREHGTMTKKLAHMFVKLCERYATRSNWRGYTYNDEMRSQALLQLSQIGLQFDESKSQNPFAYYTAAITNSFTRVLNIEKRNQNLRDDILEMNGLTPSYTRQGLSSWGGSAPSGDFTDD